MRRSGLICSFLVFCVLAAGCGGSDSGGISKEAFTRQANAICVKANKKAGSKLLAAYNLPGVKHSKSEGEAIKLEVTVFVPILIEDAEADLAGIGALDVPSGDEGQIEALLNAYEAWLKKAKGTPFKVVVANDIYNTARELAGKYGLDKCSLSAFQSME